MSVVAYHNEDEVLVTTTEDELAFVARTYRDLSVYRRVELAPGEVFHLKIFQPRLIVHRLIET